MLVGVDDPSPNAPVDTRVLLIRHGESRAQELGIVGGHRGCQGLSELGRRQVETLGDRLVSSRRTEEEWVLYASIMPRAVETASMLSATLGGPEPVRDCNFCEHHPGEGDGLTWDEYQARYPVPDTWDPHLRRGPGAETWTEMAERVASGLDALVDRHRGETVLVACHGGVIIHSLLRWLGIDPPGSVNRAWMNPANASITEWRFTDPPSVSPGRDASRSIELVRFNDHAHLIGLT